MEKFVKFLITAFVFALFMAVIYAFVIGVFRGWIGMIVGIALLVLTGGVTTVCGIVAVSSGDGKGKCN